MLRPAAMDAQRLNTFARQHLTSIALSLLAIVFVLCISTTIGWAMGGLYVLPVVLVALWSSSRSYFLVTAVATLATAGLSISFFSSSHWGNRLVALTCYVLPVAAVWESALLSLLRKWVKQSVQQAKTLPLCALCKLVRDERGWTSEAYMQVAPGTLLRLALCPSCAPKLGSQFNTGSLAENGAGRPPDVIHRAAGRRRGGRLAGEPPTPPRPAV